MTTWAQFAIAGGLVWVALIALVLTVVHRIGRMGRDD